MFLIAFPLVYLLKFVSLNGKSLSCIELSSECYSIKTDRYSRSHFLLLFFLFLACNINFEFEGSGKKRGNVPWIFFLVVRKLCKGDTWFFFTPAAFVDSSQNIDLFFLFILPRYRNSLKRENTSSITSRLSIRPRGKKWIT